MSEPGKLLQVLGPGCAKCTKVMENVKTAVASTGVDAQIEKVTDINAITGFGVMTTPALVVDGEVKVVGKVPSVEEVKALLN